MVDADFQARGRLPVGRHGTPLCVVVVVHCRLSHGTGGGASRWRPRTEAQDENGSSHLAASFDQLLGLLRRSPVDVPLALIALMQARCWARLGHADVAVRFLEEAPRLDPQQTVVDRTFLEEIERPAQAAEAGAD